MALKDKALRDRLKVFTRNKHFASDHTWNGRKFTCVVDEDAALKRKNNNVNDISWDNNTIETLIYVRKEDWPDHDPVPNEWGYFDNVYMKIMQRQLDEGEWSIVLSANSPKAVRPE